MSSFLEKFKTKIHGSKTKGVVGVLKGDDAKVFKALVWESIAWNDTTKIAIVEAAKARREMKIKVETFWKDITPRYNFLDEATVYDINPDTGEVFIAKEQPQKGGNNG